jgi:hypothetical protein
MNTRLEPKEWKLEEINWQKVSEIQIEDIIRFDDLKIAQVIGWLGDLKGAVSGQIFGRKFLLDLKQGPMKELWVIEGHGSAWVTE